jgi:gamma-glutamylcyclotransferase
MGSLLYFAYGSNLDVDQMLTRCPTARPRTRARLPDHRLEFTHLSRRWGGGAADILPHPGESVWGALYDLDADELEKLDRFEGGYERLGVRVEVAEGQVRSAVTYTVRVKASFAPTEEYVSKLLRWGAHWELPDAYLARLHTLPGIPPAGRPPGEGPAR